MKTLVKPDFKSKTFCRNKSYTPLKEKQIRLTDLKFYQKLFIVLFSLSTILIFSESPRELEDICLNNYSKQLCIVW